MEKSHKIKICETIHHPVELENRYIDFFEQKNGNDCGACMLLNMQSALGVKYKADWVTDVKNMREWLSQHSLTGANYRDYGRGGSWIQMSDLRQYVHEQLGLEQNTVKGAPRINILSRQRQQTIAINSRSDDEFIDNQGVSIDDLSNDERDKFIWGVYRGTRNEHGGGNHFSGYLQTAKGVYLFDSLGHQSYQAKTQADLDDFVQNTVGGAYVIYGFKPSKIEIPRHDEFSKESIKILGHNDSYSQVAINAFKKLT